ncbi:helix-turn-helix domain-containing protein [Deinococcus aluminii]
MTTVPDTTPRTCQPEAAQKMLGVGRGTIYELIRTGQLRSIRVGRKILIPLSAIEEFLNGSFESGGK